MSANYENAIPTREIDPASAQLAETQPAEQKPAAVETRLTKTETELANAETELANAEMQSNAAGRGVPKPASTVITLREPSASLAANPPRPRKEAVLPEIARLSLEGHSSREIGRRLGIPRRTVDRWLAGLRQEWGENAAKNDIDLYATAMARLETVYREAMQAWRRSLDDKQATVEPLPGEGEDDAKTKGSLRRTTQSGKAALLGQAIRAAVEISKFNSKHTCVAERARERERDRARCELEEELRQIPLREFREVKKMLDKPAAFRSPNELFEELTNLSEADYREIYEHMLRDFVRHLPKTRPARTECDATENESDKASGSNRDGALQYGPQH